MDTLEAPKLDSFESAKRWFLMTKPIRGHKDKVRPLGRRRYHGRGNIAMPDDNTVDLDYYKSTVVRWKSDNTFTVQFPGYVSAFCIDDLCGFTPPMMWFEWSERRLVLCFREGDGTRRYVMEKDDVFHFSVTGEGRYELHNKKRANKYVKRRGVVPKIVNERYGAFLDWATVVTGVTPIVSREEGDEAFRKMTNEAGLPTPEELQAFRNQNDKLFERMGYWTDARDSHYVPFNNGGRGRWFHTPSCEVLDSWLTGEPEGWVFALRVMGVRLGLYNWRLHQYDVTIRHVRCFVDNIVMHLFRNEVFTEVEMPDGVVPPRNNHRYFETRTIRDIPTECRVVQP
jgi:hypothetical protein